MKTYSNEEISIPFDDMIKLRKSGKLQLGLDNDVAMKVADNSEFAPSSIKTTMAMHFWSLVAVGQFLYSIYESITGIWWVFIPSFILMFAIHKANKKGTAQNLLDEAQKDKGFYEKIRKASGWLYQTDSETANKFKV